MYNRHIYYLVMITQPQQILYCKKFLWESHAKFEIYRTILNKISIHFEHTDVDPKHRKVLEISFKILKAN